MWIKQREESTYICANDITKLVVRIEAGLDSWILMILSRLFDGFFGGVLPLLWDSALEGKKTDRVYDGGAYDQAHLLALVSQVEGSAAL
jgi:hypothetical protein